MSSPIVVHFDTTPLFKLHRILETNFYMEPDQETSRNKRIYGQECSSATYAEYRLMREL